MSLFESLGSKGGSAPMNPMQMVQQLRSDPVAVLKQRGLSIPSGMNNPQQIVNHLIQTGQVPQSRLTQIMQMMGRN